MALTVQQAAPPLILVVEDEVLVAMAMEDLIRDLGYHVLGPAPTVPEANGLLDNHRPAAALLDFRLRGETVEPIARRLRQHEIPFALVTGHARSQFDGAALAHAPRLNKPVSKIELARVLHLLLELR